MPVVQQVLVVSAVTSAVIASVALIAERHARAQETPTFKSSVDVVSVTATVTDRGGRLVAGLTRDDFTVLEDGRRRDVLHFTDESVPVSLGILLDASGSMGTGKLRLARESIARLVTDDLDRRTEWFFARFGYSLAVMQDWTTDRAAIVQPLREVRATGDTTLYDSVALAVPLAQSGRFEKKALLVVSDGGETKSLLSLEMVQEAIGQSDVRVYAIGVDDTNARGGERLNMSTLRRLSEETGGRAEAVSETASIRAATVRLADELRHQYLLSYSTDAHKDGRMHTIRVEVRGSDMRVRARKGFVAD
jgi:Ca-activated chloride channel family protein